MKDSINEIDLLSKDEWLKYQLISKIMSSEYPSKDGLEGYVPMRKGYPDEVIEKADILLKYIKGNER